MYTEAVQWYVLFLNSYLLHSLYFVRLKTVACECQKTENIDLVGMLTGCENCFQCIQRLMAIETDPIRIVIIRYKIKTNTFFFSLSFSRKSGLEQLISALVHHKRIITAKKQQLEFPMPISNSSIMAGELHCNMDM